VKSFFGSFKEDFFPLRSLVSQISKEEGKRRRKRERKNFGREKDFMFGYANLNAQPKKRPPRGGGFIVIKS
tara:strand:- start:945 stop:1157 length:213 start_codon:yes stop_codon:yes gene_type:complete